MQRVRSADMASISTRTALFLSQGSVPWPVHAVFFSRQKCQEIFETILTKEYSDFRYAKVHRLTVDAYCLQHPATYMISPKSFAAHLTGMCCAMAYGNDPHLRRILQQWLNGRKQLEKPPMLTHFGSLTISHVADVQDGAEHAKLVNEWAAEVWKAYAVYHDLARNWIATAQRECIAK